MNAPLPHSSRSCATCLPVEAANTTQEAWDAYRLAGERARDVRFRAMALYQQARMAMALGRRAEAKVLADESTASFATKEARALVDYLNRSEGPVTADTIERQLKLAADTQTGAPGRRIDLPIEFEFDQDRLAESGFLQEAELCKALSAPEFAGLSFLVVGHTDSRGASDYNQALSERRAQAVIRLLTGSCGIDSKRLRGEGRGSRESLSRGNSDEDYRMDRRVEVQVVGR